VDSRPSERMREAQETLEALRRVALRHHPTHEDIANFHDVHARHERAAGREDRADAAQERARQARARAVAERVP